MRAWMVRKFRGDHQAQLTARSGMLDNRSATISARRPGRILPATHSSCLVGGVTMPDSRPDTNRTTTDYLTIIAISLLAYTLAVSFHEHLGHGLACLTLGGHPAELGAFYVHCQDDGMPDFNRRLVALAGPLMSLITGAAGLLLLDRLSSSASHLRYAAWLFGTIGLMTAAGYVLFSGVTGVGDLGTTRDGALYLATPEWLWRVALVVFGGASYGLVIYLSLRKMDQVMDGDGSERVRRAQRLALTSYLTGGVMSVLIGLLNPKGFLIVLISAAASSLGGTSGLAWMMQLLDRKKPSPAPPLRLNRSWAWIIAGFTVAVVYAIIFGPTLRL
jgi:hypothetical protein